MAGFNQHGARAYRPREADEPEAPANLEDDDDDDDDELARKARERKRAADVRTRAAAAAHSVGLSMRQVGTALILLFALTWKRLP